MSTNKGPKCLVLDIETLPIVAEVWDIWDQNIGLNQIVEDWTVGAWAAKWLHAPASEMMYMDQRNIENIRDDKALLRIIWELLDAADIVITQNGKKFDIKKLNTRFILNGMLPPSSFRQIDTLVIAKKIGAFTSNKLEYLTDKICTKYKKLKHTKYPGHLLWRECRKGNRDAWEHMERYNKHDVLSTEELYTKLQAWDQSINFKVYGDFKQRVCNCGSTKVEKKGFAYTSTGKYQRYICLECGANTAGKANLLTTKRKKGGS